MKVVIDTCIIIDGIQNRHPYVENAGKIFKHAANRTFEGYLTAKSVSDIYYLTHKCTHDDVRTRQILKDLFVLFDVADTKGIDIKKALISSMADYEDAIMAETADRENVNFIVTRNIKDYKESHIPAITPEEFLYVIGEHDVRKD